LIKATGVGYTVRARWRLCLRGRTRTLDGAFSADMDDHVHSVNFRALFRCFAAALAHEASISGKSYL